ncbi:Trimeric GatFAB AmidoTransferase(AdT) complex subunit [Ceratocystis pirilliformis]|uniref:Glutamyl-tRNA(Gln) amidotransferase subunit A, mitochondrial n=1 Tax=Ceratocystis pirilliformis TaxID=259994 RepID=A0ABR3ZIF5_9PEZI
MQSSLRKCHLDKKLLRHCRLGSTLNKLVSETNHWITKRPDSAIDADLKTPGSFRLAIKDNITTGVLSTSCASRILEGYTSPFEATIVAQLRARNGVIVGTTNMDEFGMGSHSVNSAFGPVINGTSTATELRSAGGSSGGSAVAVQVGEADVALGTDTGGSVRLPAAYTGVVGLKPSYGMISRYGVVPYANSLDTVGLLAPQIDPIYRLLFEQGIYLEHDPKDPTSLSVATRQRCAKSHGPPPASLADAMPRHPHKITIGIPLEYNVDELDPRIRATWAAAAEEIETWGARVVPVSLPSTRHALSAYYIIASAEASSNLAKYDGVRYGKDNSSTIDESNNKTLYADTRRAGLGPEVRRRILLGAYSLSSEAMNNYFIQAQRVRRAVQRDFDRVFALLNPLYTTKPFDLSEMGDDVVLDNKLGPPQVDFLLVPTAPTFAPRLDQALTQPSTAAYANDVFTVPASLAGLPAVNVPVKAQGKGTNEGHNVVGLQLIAQFWDDARLLGMAQQLAKIMSSL